MEAYLKKTRRATVILSLGKLSELYRPDAPWKTHRATIQSFFRSKGVCCDFIYAVPSFYPVCTVDRPLGRFCQVSEKCVVTPFNASSCQLAKRDTQILINVSQSPDPVAEACALHVKAPVKVCFTNNPQDDSDRLKKYNMVLSSEGLEEKGFDEFFPMLTMLLESLG